MDQGQAGIDADVAFGLIAMREGAVSPEALSAALLAWDHDRSRSLRAVLVGIGALSEIRAEEIEAKAVDVEMSRAGRFRVLRLLAQGGLGEVFVAEDTELHREVALKEIRPHLVGLPDNRARFVVEAEITGGLEHPGIVPVYSLGRHEDGRPYYAMRLVRGQTLLDAIRKFHEPDGPLAADLAARSRELRRLLTRFVAVCEAIAYAHSRRVIHRDLKPRNILLGRFGETLVVDWGSAKAIDDPDLASTAVDERPMRPASGRGVEATLEGRAVGTPAYMSPEQAECLPEALAPAADVYGLGATLYHLLTGRAPFEDDDPEKVLRLVRLGEFPPPRAVRADVHPALAAICSKAMARRTLDRYHSAGDLADDVERWLGDEPVLALREAPPAQLARWGRRHQSGVVAAVAAMLLLLSGLAVLSYRQKLVFVDELHKTEAKNRKADHERDLLESARAVAEANRELKIKDYYARFDRAREARSTADPGWTGRALSDLAEAARLDDGFGEPEALRDEAIRALSTVDLRRDRTLDPGIDSWIAPSIAVSPGGRRIAAIRHRPLLWLEYTGRVLDVATGRPTHTLRFRPRLGQTNKLESVNDVAFGPVGRWLAVATSGGLVHLWDLEQADPSPISWPAHDKPVYSLAFSPDGRSLYTASEDGTLRRWRVGEAAADGPLASAPISPGARVWRLGDCPELLAVRGRSLCRFEPEGLREVGSVDLGPLPETIEHVCPSPDGRAVAFVAGGRVGLMPLDGGPPRMLEGGRISRTTQSVHFGLRFSHDGALLMAFHDDFHGRDRGVKVWEVGPGRLASALQVSGSERIGAAFSPDGRGLYMVEDRKLVDHKIVGLDVRGWLAQTIAPIRAIALQSDGSTLAALARTAAGPDLETIEASLWDVPAGTPRARRLGPVEPMLEEPTARLGLAFHPSGRRLALASGAALLHFWNLDDPEGGWTSVDTGGIHPLVAFDESGRRLWGIMGLKGSDDRVFALDPDRPPVETRWVDSLSRPLHGYHGLNDLAVAAGSVLVAGHDGDCHLFREGDPADTPPTTWAAGSPSTVRDPAHAIALTPDGTWAAIGTLSGKLHLKAAPLGRPAMLREAHRDSIGALAFSRDGRALATGSADRTIRLWSFDGRELRPLATLPAPTAPALALAFSPDGGRLYALLEGEHAVRVWDLGRLRGRLREMGLGW